MFRRPGRVAACETLTLAGKGVHLTRPGKAMRARRLRSALIFVYFAGSSRLRAKHFTEAVALLREYRMTTPAIIVLSLGGLLVLFGLLATLSTGFRHATNGRLIAWLNAKFGRGHNVEELARRLGIPADELRAFKPSYREAMIPKRSGGQRKLFVPDVQTKQLQRMLLRRVFARLRAHPAAMGFERGRSIVHNALPHVGRAIVLKMDIVDFFPTTTAARLDDYFRRIGWDREAAALLVRLTTHRGGLPQGAPASPRLSNLVNYFLDVQLASFARRRKGAYTRYADDITFSFPKDYPKRVRGVFQKVRSTLKSKGYQMHQRKKLSVHRRHQRQTVTGLVVNQKPQLDRRRRRWLRAVNHRMKTQGSASLSAAELAGWEALQKMIREQSAIAAATPA